MTHARTQIRHKFVDVLSVITGAKVEATRVSNYAESELPGIAIFPGEEKSSGTKMIGDAMVRMLEIMVEIRVKRSADADDVLDGYSAQVETLLGVNRKLDGLLIDSELESSIPEFDDETDKTVGLMTLKYVCLFRVNRSNPEVIF